MLPFKYPYTNFHELNLDWILSKIESIPEFVRSEIGKSTTETVYHYVDAISAGVSEDTPNNNSVIMNRIINERTHQLIFLGAGKFQFDSPIEFKQSFTIFVSAGEIISTADYVFQHSAGNNVTIIANNITGNGQNIGLYVDGRTSTRGQNTYCINFFNHLNIGISCDARNSNGVMNSFFKWVMMYYTTHGIELYADNVGFVNQNNFYGGGFRGETGIRTYKGPGMVDPFNGNVFENIQFEGCSGAPIKLEFADCNTFSNFRLWENKYRPYIELEECRGNRFESAIFAYWDNDIIVSDTYSNDKNFFFAGRVTINGGVYDSVHFVVGDGEITPLDKVFNATVEVQNERVLCDPFIHPHIVLKSVEKPVAVSEFFMSRAMTIHSVPPVVVDMVGDRYYNVSVFTYNGTPVLLNPENNSRYILTKAEGNTWVAQKIADL